MSLSSMLKNVNAAYDKAFDLMNQKKEAEAMVEAAKDMAEIAKGTPLEGFYAQLVQDAEENVKTLRKAWLSAGSDACSYTNHVAGKI